MVNTVKKIKTVKKSFKKGKKWKPELYKKFKTGRKWRPTAYKKFYKGAYV